MVNFTMLVRNRPRLTRQAIESLALVSSEWGDMWSGAKRAPSITVLILDDRSDKETSDYLASLPESDSLEIVRNDDTLGTGQLRNLAISASRECFGRGEFLYLSDNDCYFVPGWLPCLIEAYKESWNLGYSIIGGVNHPFHQPISFDPLKGRWPVSNIMEVHALALQSWLMRWQVFEHYGPFCDTPVDRVCQSEDVAFSNKLKADGFRVGVVSPALIVNTGITNSFGEKIPGWELVKAQCPEGVICE